MCACVPVRVCAHRDAVSAEEHGSRQDVQQEEQDWPVPQFAEVEAPEGRPRTWGEGGGAAITTDPFHRDLPRDPHRGGCSGAGR